ncbi:RpeA, partial [Nosema bombycis CQ1]
MEILKIYFLLSKIVAVENKTYESNSSDREKPTNPEDEKPTNPESKKPTNPEGKKLTEPEGESPTEPEGEKPTDPEGENFLTRLHNGYYDNNLPSKNDFRHIEREKQTFLTVLLKKSLDKIGTIAVRLEDAVDSLNRPGRETLVKNLETSSQGLNLIYLLIGEKASLQGSHPQKVYLIVEDSKKFLGDIMYLLSMSLQLTELPKEQDCYDIVWKSIGELADVIFQLDKVINTLEELGYKAEHLNLHPSREYLEDLDSTKNYDSNAHTNESLPEESNRQNETEKAEVLRSANGSPTAIMTQNQDHKSTTAQFRDLRQQKTNLKDVVSKSDVTNVQNGNSVVRQNTDIRLQIAKTQKSKVTDHKASNIRLQNNNNGGLQNNLVAKPQIIRSQRKKGLKAAISKVSSSYSHSTARGVVSKAVDGKFQGRGVKSQSNVKNVKSQGRDVESQRNTENIEYQGSIKNVKVRSNVEDVKSQGSIKNVKVRSNVEDVKSQGVVSKVDESNKLKVDVLTKDVNPELPNEKTQDKKSQCMNGILYRGSPISCVSIIFTISRN